MSVESQEWIQFLRVLRNDLNHLYDPAYLRKSSLISWFGLQGQVDAVFKLQQLLVKAIDQLENAEESRPISKYTYSILKNRYVLQVPQVELANTIGMSERQLRREQMTAIEFLATQLWNAYGLAERLQATQEALTPIGEERPTGDLDWLQSEQETTACDPNTILVDVVDLIAPLLSLNKVYLDLDVDGPLPLVKVHGVALQQALLSILNYQIQGLKQGALRLSADQREAHVEIAVASRRMQGEAEPNGQVEEVLFIARRLLQMFSAHVQMLWDEQEKGFLIRLPVLQRTFVLVIDDNHDFFELLQRYLTGSAYEIIGLKILKDPIEQIAALMPGIIILDIMMPGIDGWELLKSIKTNAAICDIPVVISTILPQKSLALALGADDFLQKPITQTALLAVLDRWTHR